MSTFIISNPTRRKKRRSKSKSKTRARRRPAATRRRRSSAGRTRTVSRRRAPVARKTTRKRRTTRRAPSRRGGFINTDLLMGAATVAGGAMATQFIAARAPYINTMTGFPGVAAKAGVALGIGLLVGKVGGNRNIGTQLALGGLATALAEGVNLARAGLASPGVSGLGHYPLTPGQYVSLGPGRLALNGLGAYGDDAEVRAILRR